MLIGQYPSHDVVRIKQRWLLRVEPDQVVISSENLTEVNSKSQATAG